MSEIKVVIDGVGSCIPDRVVKNEDFLNSDFYQENGERFEAENDVIIQKFESITGIRERRYANDNQNSSDLAAIAAEKALRKWKYHPKKEKGNPVAVFNQSVTLEFKLEG